MNQPYFAPALVGIMLALTFMLATIGAMSASQPFTQAEYPQRVAKLATEERLLVVGTPLQF